jgi:hypothetical protein
MVAALKKTVTIQPGGRIEISSPKLRAGAKAEVIVILNEQQREGRSAKQCVRPSKEALRKAGREFERFIGAASLGHPTGADNESIDADLAREYGNTHED